MYSQCKYCKFLKCTECKHPYHKECKRFMVARAKDISKVLLPFRFSSKVEVTDQVMWSRDINKAKSIALKYGIRANAKIKKYTLSQVISLALANEYVEESVVYIEYSNKLTGDIEKVKGVLISFIEGLTMRGTYVALYVAPSLTFNLDYNKV